MKQKISRDCLRKQGEGGSHMSPFVYTEEGVGSKIAKIHSTKFVYGP